MNKFQLIQKICKDAHLRRSQSIRAVKSLVGAIRETIKNGGKISLTGLGTFKVKARKARPGRNPKTGAVIAIPAGRKISFKPSLSLKKLVKSI
jgi:DNA-binding protein HU-beta